mmetsp:Transcript_17981/g.30601  ORF Transcript_17981/g.30601 Transcript_17981/m.30601 type:complete len:309 (-) Transcript_17981:404-1330(-)
MSEVAGIEGDGLAEEAGLGVGGGLIVAFAVIARLLVTNLHVLAVVEVGVALLVLVVVAVLVLLNDPLIVGAIVELGLDALGRLGRQLLVLVEVVGLEDGLLGDAVEDLLLLLDLLRVIPAPVVHVVVVEVVLLDVGDVGRLQSLLPQPLPVEFLEPGVALQVLDPVDAQPLSGHSLQTAVNEVGCLSRVAHRQVALPDSGLLVEDGLAYLLSAPAEVGPATHDALVADNPHGEVVGRDPVVLLEHDLGGHVAGRAAVLRAILLDPDLGDAEVGESEVAIRVEDEVLGLYVAMNNPSLVGVLQRLNEAG